jgi:DNA topoisomerase I
MAKSQTTAGKSPSARKPKAVKANGASKSTAAAKTNGTSKSTVAARTNGTSKSTVVAKAMAVPAASGAPAKSKAKARRHYLVVVESPAKAKTIKKYLGAEYRVKASVGHVVDLPKSKFGVDLKHGFKPQYEVIKSKAKVLDEIKALAKDSDKLFLATDPDREGEAIAWHLADAVGQKKKTYRVTFNEITKRAVQEAVANPGKLDAKKFDSQQARRVLDRLVGYKISPILWQKVRYGLSAGRVQSVAVRLVVEREEEIQKFVPKEYWTIEALLAAALPPEFKAKLVKVDGKKFDLREDDEHKPEALKKELDGLLTDLKGTNFVVAKVERKDRRRNAPPPFITSTLQQAAANQLHFTAKRTMAIAQGLYEGVELGDEGSVALITYMRTDSFRLSNDALSAVRGYIEQKYGKDHLPSEPMVFKQKKSAQDAHEAIRPTSMDYPPEKVEPFLPKDEFRLYELIWRRLVACQMMPAVFEQTTVDIDAGRSLFRANGSQLKFPGYLAVYGATVAEEEDKKKDEEAEDEGDLNKELPPLQAGEKLTLKEILPERHQTEPPPRFTEASLVKELEEKGIGRPSTYAAILSTIQSKEYTKKEEGRFYPTELGHVVTTELVQAFPNEMDVTFTAGMEEKLDRIAEGEEKWVSVIRNFWGGFEKDLKSAAEKMRDVKREEVKTEFNCEKCGKPMIIKWGRRGRFVACSGYPECRNTMDFRQGADGKIELVPQETVDEKCPTCGKPMTVKRGRFGRFIACTGYPECKTVKQFSIGVACPECKIGQLTERMSRRGKLFYSCNRYPDCKFAAWDKPLPETCPVCGSVYLLQKYSKREGPYIACPNKECSYRRTLEEQQPQPPAGA